MMLIMEQCKPISPDAPLMPGVGPCSTVANMQDCEGHFRKQLWIPVTQLC